MKWCRAFTAMTVMIGAGLSVPAVRAQFSESEVVVLRTHEAENTGDGFGFVAETIGDINDDEAPDYIIGAPFSSAGGTLSGRAYVYSGADGALISTFTGAAFQQIGFGVSGNQDIDGDGTPDYVVSGLATFNGPGAQQGRVVALSGADHSVIFDFVDPEDRTFLGYDVNLAGDVNGDGRADVIAGAPLAAGAAGRAVVLSGADGTVIWSLDGASPGLFMGTAVTGLDDLNDDESPDQGVGAIGGVEPGGVATGLAFVLSGADGSLLRTLVPENTGSSFGDFFVHDAGDVDDDGVGDIYVGDFGDVLLGPGSGRAYVFSGAMADDELDDTPVLPLVLEAENTGDGFGIGRGVGDVDDDEHADLIVAAYTSSAGANQGGKAFLISGRDGATLRTMTGTVAGDQMGFDALGLGDVNGDGLTDFLITGVDRAHVIAGSNHDED